MPGMALPIEDGGIGFDYRLGIAIPDFWIKMLKDQTDYEWNIWDMWNLLTNRLPGVKTVAYAESHDQAMVGDQTIAFRLMDKEMYTAMDIESESMVIDRGLALHKMIRLITLTAGGDAYLNFMGNEFGHPEWIDFPREGNDWSYKHARRQWSLAEDENLRFHMLQAFDHAMIKLEKDYDLLADGYPYRLQMDEGDKTIVFSHRNLVFVFNWHPTKSTNDYIIKVREPGKYKLIMSTDDVEFGGYGRMDHTSEHFTFPGEAEGEHFMQVYNVCRTACIYEKIEE
jgi:1,4-alpha-glucan branching enzyme